MLTTRHPLRLFTLLAAGGALSCVLLATPVAVQAADDSDVGGPAVTLSPGQDHAAGGMGLAGGALLGGFSLQPRWSISADSVDSSDPSASGTDDNLEPAAPLTDTSSNLYTMRGFRLSGMGTLPINQGLSLFGKVGLLGWNTGEHPANGANLFSAGNGQGLDLTYGAGGEYAFGGGLSLRAEWGRYPLNQGSAGLFSAGIRYRFK